MFGVCALSYALDQQFEYWTSTNENKMVSICPVFKWHSNTRPFGIQPIFDRLNTRLVWILNGQKEVELQMVGILNGIWNLNAQLFEIRTNGRHFVKNYLKSGQKSLLVKL